MSSNPTEPAFRSPEMVLDSVYQRAAKLHHRRAWRRAGFSGGIILLLVVSGLAVASRPWRDTELATQGAVDGTSVKSASGETLQIDEFSEVLSPGSVLVVTGSGCYPDPSIPDPLVIRLVPPHGGNAWGPTIVDDVIGTFSEAARKYGEATVEATPADDGTFAVDIPIPEDAVLGAGYTVDALCLTRLERAASQTDQFTADSLAAARATSGTLSVG